MVMILVWLEFCDGEFWFDGVGLCIGCVFIDWSMVFVSRKISYLLSRWMMRLVVF